MKYEYTTTDQMDAALEVEAKKQDKTPEELFNIIVTADMGTLVRNTEVGSKEQLYEVYQKASVEDKAKIDVIIAKAVPVEVKPIEEVIEEIIPVKGLK